MKTTFSYGRAGFYLAAAGAIWFTEAVLFSRALRFDTIQTVIVWLYFAGLYVAAVTLIVRMAKTIGPHTPSSPTDLTLARLIALAPMVTVIVGSFAALPVFVALLILGSVL